MAVWYEEHFEEKMRVALKGSRVLFSERSEFQLVEIVETELLGRALMLDGLWMCAEQDEKSYHEMLTHPALTTAREISRVLIIGGGDGGTAREVLRHAEVEQVTMVELDELVVRASKAHLPSIGQAWGDPRLDLRFEDGAAYVRDQDAASYDVILIDGSDPVGPAAALFGADFMSQCARVLKPGGVFAAQAGSPLLQRDEHLGLLSAMRGVFAVTRPYYGNVILYPGGAWSWAFGSHEVDPAHLHESRVVAAEAVTDIYNRDVHLGAFAVPNHIKRALRDG